MIHCALALRTGGAMTRFRQCMRDEVASRFVVKAGQPSRAALRHKQAVMRLFVGHGAALATKQILLALCPNGDWRAEKVEHYVAPGEVGLVDHDLLLEHVASGLISALCSAQPEVYPRHRWTGADLTTDRFGVLESCHKLLSSTFLRFAASYEHGSRSMRLLLAAGHQAGATADNTSSSCGAAPAIGLYLDEGLSGQASAGAEDMPGDPQSTADPSAWAAVNAAHRREATQWVLSAPLPRLMLQRLVMEPLRRLLASQFEVAGESWDLEQLAKTAVAAARGEQTWDSREYRVCIAASCRDEQQFFDRLRLLQESDSLWDILPLGAYTEKFASLAFKMISKAGCCVAELLRKPHTQLPFRLFGLLSNPRIADELLVLPDCMWDPWSKKMRDLHPTLADDALLHKLALLAHLQWKDISRVEAKHATVRRMLTVSSVQTHQQSLPELSAQWCCLQARKLVVSAQLRSGIGGTVQKKARPVTATRSHTGMERGPTTMESV